MNLRTPLCLLLALASLAACSYPIRNEAVPVGNYPKYAWENLPAGDDTLVIVTASGGGTRASALAVSVLQATAQVKLASGRSLADKIDIVSSVSGGSVTAAYFALHGVAGLKTFEDDFVRRDGMTPLIANLLNPFSLAALSMPAKERIDLLIDYFDRQLFKDATFDQLVKQNRRPYLILNSADMVEGTPFPFTQYTMDLLCSELRTMKISTAVAASAAFPVALSPVTLKNYCTPAAPAKVGWLQDAADTLWYVNPARVAWQRTALAYASGQKQFIHLLDGGIADNLGISEPFRMLTAGDGAPRLAQGIASGRIKKIVFVMVNARSFKPSGLDKSAATPGVLDMALGSIDSAIDRTTFNTAERLRTLLQGQFEQFANEVNNPATKANYRTAARNTQLITVDFDAIAAADCRRKFHSIATSWSLSNEEIDSLKAVGGALLVQDPNFARTLGMIGGRIEGPIASMDEACRLVPTPPE